MLGGVVAMLAGGAGMLGAPSAVATLAGLPGWVVLHVIVTIVRVAASLPFAALTLPPGVAEPAALVTGAAILLAPSAWTRCRPVLERRTSQKRDGNGLGDGARGRRSRGSARRIGRPERVAVAVAALAVAVAVAALSDAAGRATRITVMDVGQGDAILLETRTGARMLIDGGPDPDRILLALDARIPPWDRRLDVVVLTHPHEDHVAGLARVLARYSVGRVYEPGMRGPGPGWAQWNAELRDGPPRAGLQTGAQLRLGEVRLSVLWPDPGAVPLEPPDTGTGINNVSIVFLGEADGRRFLLMGDVEQGIDPTLLARGLPRVDLLKVAHHGSATASTQPFVDAVRPKVAIASAGAGNPYGHPAKSTLDRLRASGARVYRTDQDGSVEVELREDGLSVHETGGRAAAATTVAVPATAFLCAIPVPRGSPAWVAAPSTPAAAPRLPSRGTWPKRQAVRRPGRTPPDTILSMTIPDRHEAARQLASLHPSAKFTRHACAVADIAAFLAYRASRAGRAVNPRLAETAALLHDVDKLATAQAPAHLRHGEGSAAWLEAHGYPELAPAVRDHPVTRLVDPGFEAWARTASLEARIVAYADKRAAQHLAPMDARFARWKRKYPPGSGALVRRSGSSVWSEEAFVLAERRARALELEVCEAAGVDPVDVDRLRWSRRALRETST